MWSQTLRRGKAGLIVIALWSVIALLMSVITIIIGTLSHHIPDWGSVYVFEWVCISPWAISTPGIIWLAKRFRFESPRIVKSTAVHLLAALTVFLFHSVVQGIAISFFFNEFLSFSHIQRNFWVFLDVRILLYTGLILGIYSLEFAQKNREGMVIDSRLKAELNKAKFKALVNQVQPEFLLNSIETIKKTISKSPSKAEQMLTDMSGLLRIMLHNSDREEISVAEDIELILRYLDVLQRRTGQPIERVVHIQEECLKAQIPTFLMLMPIIEELGNNRKGGLKSIVINASKEEQKLKLEGILEGFSISDDELEHVIHEVNMGEVMERLYRKYQDAVKLATFVKGNKIFIELFLPYKKLGETAL